MSTTMTSTTRRTSIFEKRSLVSVPFVRSRRDFLPQRGRRTQPRVEWREDKVRMGMVLARKRPLGFSPVSSPNPNTGWKPMLH
jgi:hypothetical protein